MLDDSSLWKTLLSQKPVFFYSCCCFIENQDEIRAVFLKSQTDIISRYDVFAVKYNPSAIDFVRLWVILGLNNGMTHLRSQPNALQSDLIWLLQA